MRIDRSYESLEGRNVLYFQDVHISIDVQLAIAMELSRLFREEQIRVMAFEQPFGPLPNYVRQLSERTRLGISSLDVRSFLESTSRAGISVPAALLLQLWHQDEIEKNALQLFGVGDEGLYLTQHRLNKFYKSFVRWKTLVEERVPIPKLLAKLLERCKDSLEDKLLELSTRREDADAKNISHLLDYYGLMRLPLTTGFEHNNRLPLLLRKFYGIGTISYSFE